MVRRTVQDAEQLDDVVTGETSSPEHREVWLRWRGVWEAAEIVMMRRSHDAIRVYVRPAGAEDYTDLEIYRADPETIRPREPDARPATGSRVPPFDRTPRYAPCWVRVQGQWVPGRVLAWGRHRPGAPWVALTRMSPADEAWASYVVAWTYNPAAIVPRYEAGRPRPAMYGQNLLRAARAG